MTAQNQAVEAAEREKFEAWAVLPEIQLDITRHPDYPRAYKDYTTAWAHSAWNGRTELTGAQPAPVPVAVGAAMQNWIDTAEKLCQQWANCANGAKPIEDYRASKQAVLRHLRTPPGEQGDAKDASQLTPDEMHFCLEALSIDHPVNKPKLECPGCTAYRKLAAILASKPGEPT